MSADTDRLIAKAREAAAYTGEPMYGRLADALEAATDELSEYSTDVGYAAGYEAARERAEAAEAQRDTLLRDGWYVETFPTGEGIEELRKARAGEGLDANETVTALRAAMEVADAAKRRGQRAERLLDEWLEHGHLSAGGYGGDLRERTRAALAGVAPPEEET